MNRLLLLPCVASLMSFACLATFSSPDGSGATACANAHTNLLMSADQIEKEVVDRWNRHNESRLAFSRVFRPSQYMEPRIMISEMAISPSGPFIGTITLEDRMHQGPDGLVSADQTNKTVPTMKYPIVIDRQTGNAVVFSSGRWADFDQWVVNWN